MPHVDRAAAFNEALAAGLPVRSAARWPDYLAMKAARGEEPITLAEAVRQKLHAIIEAGR